MLTESPEAQKLNEDDHEVLRWCFHQRRGYATGTWLQAPPFFFTAHGHALPLIDRFRGRSCFLVCGGPSFKNVKRKFYDGPGRLTMAVNNAPKSFRPDMWCSVDSPDSWIRSIWLDPRIEKFAPLDHTRKPIFDSDAWQMMDVLVRDCPNVVYYRRNELFNPQQFLWEDTINWGNCGDKEICKDLGISEEERGGRSVMLAAIRILFLQGVRRIFLLGCDFNMTEQQTYHFDQGRHKGSVRGNTDTYSKLNNRFAILRPIFEQAGLQVFNCNLDSKLKAFDKITPRQASSMIDKEEFPVNVAVERTQGLYDRKRIAKDHKKWKKKLADTLAKAQKERDTVAKCRTNKGRQEHTQTAEKLEAQAMEYANEFHRLEELMNGIRDGWDVNIDK